MIKAEIKFNLVTVVVSISKDGDKWCALLGEDIQSGITGFGETPEEALSDFQSEFMRWSKKS